MSKTTQEDKLEKVDFKWGVKRGRGGAKKDVQFYESFTYDGMEYFLYDSVYLFKDNEPEPYVGKLIKIWEHSNKAKRVKILWFFRPSEILDYLQNEKVLDNELFLATGDGVGLANINPLEAIARKCNIVCISKDDRNRRPSMEELEMADHVFYRTFDVDKRTISDKLGEKIAAVEVKLLLNKTPSILPKSNSNGEGDSGNMVSNMEKMPVQSVTSPRDGEPVKAVGNLDSSVVKEGVTVTESVKIRLKSPDSETYKHDRSGDPSDGQFKSSFGKLCADSSNDSASSAAAVIEKAKLDLAKDFHQRVDAAQKVKSVNDRGVGEERPYKKLKCEGLGKQSSDNFKNDVDKLLADSHSSEDKFSPRLARNASENKVESFGIDKSSAMKLKSNEVKTKIPNEMLGKSSRKKIKDVPIEAYGQVVEVTRRPNADRSKWFTALPWEDRMKAAHDQGTLVLLQNLDPAYTASEVEDIVWHGFKESCTAKMVQRTATSSPHYGQAFVIFKTREAAEKVIAKLDRECLMLPNGRPLIASIGVASFPAKVSSFPGHLIIDKLRPQFQKEASQKAVSTSHSSQPNTIEYDLAMEWRLLLERSSFCWRKMHKRHGEELKKLKANLKLK